MYLCSGGGGGGGGGQYNVVGILLTGAIIPESDKFIIFVSTHAIVDSLCLYS